MALSDLEHILKKDPIVATYPAAYLSKSPTQVERVYRTHAGTYVPLGDTTVYIEKILRWLGGGNQGAFIGAVSGEFGHGKTSFQIHVWEQCCAKRILAVPPFHWESVSDMLEGTAAWVRYTLQDNPECARQAARLHETYRERTLREVAEQTARDHGKDVDQVLAILRAAGEDGLAQVNVSVSPDRFLDYCAEVTTVVQQAGYTGLLVLLDEPEVAARKLGTSSVTLILFEIANGLLQREGNYGVFVSIPENFLSQALSMQSALPARLDGRKCFPRLGDLYGPDFARDLWSRYVTEFGLGEEASRVVSPETLVAIGQVGSSGRRDLSYGPRTVVSAFNCMVHHYREVGKPYTPDEFIYDCLDDEVMTKPDYSTRVLQALDQPQLQELDRHPLRVLAAFPNGLPLNMAAGLGVRDSLLDVMQRGGPVVKRGELLRLSTLRPEQTGVVEHDELEDALMDIAGQFAPSPATFRIAQEAFIEYIVPVLFEPKEGQQLLGWESPSKWGSLNRGLLWATLTGAFRETVKDYPRRRVLVTLGSAELADRDLAMAREQGNGLTDIALHFSARWDREAPLPDRRLSVSFGDAAAKQPATVHLVMDWAGEALEHDALSDLLTPELLTPLGVLYLMGEMRKHSLTQEYQAEWDSVRLQLVRELVTRFLGDPRLRQEMIEQVGRTPTGGATELLGSTCRAILRERYPDYSTLIRQPRWESKVRDYAMALKNPGIPLASKRGLRPWKVPAQEAAKALGTNAMNLTGGSFTGFENLIAVKTNGHKGPLEVTFKIHPLEQDLMDRICAERPSGRLKIKGKECWWLPVEEVLPLLLASGYREEEIQHIVEIGEARGTFNTGQHNHRPILYCLPIDPDQMKAQLRAKLQDLRAERAEFEKLPDYHSSLDLKALEGEIEALVDEAQYESLSVRMHSDFEQNHHRLPGYFGRLAESLNTVKVQATQIEQELKGSREAATLQQTIKAVSCWSGALATIIVPALKQLMQQAVAKCAELRQDVDKALTDYSGSRPGPVLEQVGLLVAGFGEVAASQARLESAKTDCHYARERLREYEEWRRLLALSDTVHEQMAEFQNDPAHAAVAHRMLDELEEVCRDLEEHLRTRQLTGLASYRQYGEQYRKVDSKRQDYAKQLKAAFDQRKERTNDLLKHLNLGIDARCQEVFNPADAAGCYERLDREAWGYVIRALSGEYTDIGHLKQELLYARDILSQVPSSAAARLLTALDERQKALEGAQTTVTPAWVAQAALDPNGRDGIRDCLAAARETIVEAKKALRAAATDGKEPMGEGAQRMLDLIPANEPVDLKRIVLKLMTEGSDSTQILNAALESLAELFRRGKVQIRVELPRR